MKINQSIKDILKKYNLTTLKNIAKLSNIEKSYKMKKDELIENINNTVTENFVASVINSATQYEIEEYIKLLSQNIKLSKKNLPNMALWIKSRMAFVDENENVLVPLDVYEMFEKVIFFNKESYKKLVKFFVRENNSNAIEAQKLAKIVYWQIKDKKTLEEIIFLLGAFGVEFPTSKKIEKFKVEANKMWNQINMEQQ